MKPVQQTHVPVGVLSPVEVEPARRQNDARFERKRAWTAGLVILGATIGLPFFGAWASGRDLSSLFQFPPPLNIPTDYPRFSWWALLLVIAPFGALTIAWNWKRGDAAQNSTASTGKLNRGPPPIRAQAPAGTRGLTDPESDRHRFHRWPAWGTGALVWTLAWWVLAWSRFAWFQPWQQYTFFPLWLGFIAAMNAVTYARIGTSLLARAPGRILLLFGTSAAFWWIFEWLNRFTHNWHYLGVADFGALAYAANATLCFSTVLPAVSAVAELLATFEAWGTRCAEGPRFPWLRGRATGIVLVAIGGLGLIGAGAAPERFYAALWSAPLALLLGDSVLRRRHEIPAELAVGDWRTTATWAVAALLCGFCWEMWNVFSAAHWIYTVPYTERWHVFAMPILGYTGYLPFGLEVYFVVCRLYGSDFVLPFSRVSST